MLPQEVDHCQKWIHSSKLVGFEMIGFSSVVDDDAHARLLLQSATTGVNSLPY